MVDDPYDAARQSQTQAARRRRRRLASQARQPAASPKAAHVPVGSPTQQRGHAAEARASQLLQAGGLRILAANLQCRAGEIDLVAQDAEVLVFIEVRQRNSPRFGGAAASVNRRKQRRLIRAARYFLPSLARRCFAGRIPACRFDVVALEGTELHWIRDAFQGDRL